MNRRILKKTSVKTRLRSAALKLFSKQGIDGTAINDIVKAAKTTQPMLYYYYGNKDKLCLEIFRELSDELLDGANRIIGRKCPLEQKLEALFTFYRDYCSGRPGIARFFLHAALSVRYGDMLRAAGEKVQALNQKNLARMLEMHGTSGEAGAGHAEATRELINAVIIYYVLNKGNTSDGLGRHSLPGRMAHIILKGSNP